VVSASDANQTSAHRAPQPFRSAAFRAAARPRVVWIPRRKCPQREGKERAAWPQFGRPRSEPAVSCYGELIRCNPGQIGLDESANERETKVKTHREHLGEPKEKSPRLAKAIAEAQSEERLAILLARLRERRGWTQRQLARAAGIRQTQIARIESGSQFPNLETLWKLADALDATVKIGPGRGISIEAKRTKSSRR